MKKLLKAVFVLAALFCLSLSVPKTAEAATKAVKVSVTRQDHPSKDDYERLAVEGKSKNGETVWTYKTKYYTSGQSLHYFTHKKKVYICTEYKMVCLNISNGKKVWSKNLKPLWISYMYYHAFDKKGNLYLIAYNQSAYTTTAVCKLTKKGKKVWQKNIVSLDLFGLGSFKCKNGQVVINAGYPAEGEVSKVVMSAKTGKVIKYYYK